MKKASRIFIFIIGAIILLWGIGRVTNAIQFYSSPTPSNYPSIKIGGSFFASNLKQPKRFDFICYYAITPEFGKEIWIHRLCGIEGDVIEIRNGDLYVNNIFVDETLNVANNYTISISDYNKIKEKEDIEEFSQRASSSDSVMTFVAESLLKKYSIKGNRNILSENFKDEYLFEEFDKNWNQDHFGPVVVPEDKYFVLGDNRLLSRDSRYIGFIDKNDFVGTAFISKSVN